MHVIPVLQQVVFLSDIQVKLIHKM